MYGFLGVLFMLVGSLGPKLLFPNASNVEQTLIGLIPCLFGLFFLLLQAMQPNDPSSGPRNPPPDGRR